MRRKRHSIHSERVQVVRINRRRQAVSWLVAVGLLLAFPLVVYQVALQHTGDELRSLELNNRQLMQESESLKLEREQLQQQIANLELAAELNEQAMNRLREQLVSWRERSEQQSEQIQFYLSLMDPASGSDGVFVDRADIAATAEPGRFRYQVVVGQKSQNHDRVTGSMNILVHNGASNPVQSVQLGELSDQQTPLPLGFKFFQNLEGVIYLPADFEPSGWTLQFDIRTPVRQVFSQDLEWQVKP